MQQKSPPAFLGARVTQATRQAFINRAQMIPDMNVSEVMRELIDAFIEDRITIRPKKSPLMTNKE